MWQQGICAQILSLWGNKDGGMILGGGNDIHLLHIIMSLEKPRTLILVLISIGLISGLASEAMRAWVQHAWSFYFSGLSLIICQMAFLSLMLL